MQRGAKDDCFFALHIFWLFVKRTKLDHFVNICNEINDIFFMLADKTFCHKMELAVKMAEESSITVLPMPLSSKQIYFHNNPRTLTLLNFFRLNF